MNDPPTRAGGPEPRISAECQKLLDTVRKRCPGLLPGDPVTPGTVVDDVALKPAEAAALFPAAAVLAAGVDQPGADPKAQVLWREGDLELLVQPAGVTARFATGVVVVTIPSPATRPATRRSTSRSWSATRSARRACSPRPSSARAAPP